MALERWDKHFDKNRPPVPKPKPFAATLSDKGKLSLSVSLTRELGGLRAAQFFLDREADPPLLLIKFVPEGEEEYDRHFSVQKCNKRGTTQLVTQIRNMCREWRISLARKRRFPATWDAARRTVTVRFREVEG
jgi:hypothetical protein